MTRKDSTFNTHWNRGFEIIYSNGRYKQLCDSVNTKHAGMYIIWDLRPKILFFSCSPILAKIISQNNPYP